VSIAKCPECVSCSECRETVYCLSEPRATWHPACPHLEPICGDCWPGTCTDCILEAERQLFVSPDGVGLGEYDPRKDPLYDHTAPDPGPPHQTYLLDGNGKYVPYPRPPKGAA
jgi:hypothetical protein